MSKGQTVSKTTHSLQSPYQGPKWPLLSPQTETTIVDCLLRLIRPIGQYRREHVPKSKGQNRKKKKNNKNDKNNNDYRDDQSLLKKDSPTIQPPDVLQYLTIGFNSTVRKLERLAQPAISKHNLGQAKEAPDSQSSGLLVFVAVSDLPLVMTHSLPLLAAIASSRSSESRMVRLIPISQESSRKVSDALGQPSANFLSIASDAPGVESLQTMVQAHVPSLKVPWLQDSTEANYHPVKIYSERVTIDSNLGGKEAKRKADRMS